MNIVFLGTPLFAKEILEGLMKNHTILSVITQPDKPFGRKKILKAPEVKECALANNIPCFQPEKSIDIIEILHNIDTKQKIEAIIVVAYGKILKKEIVSRYICLNLHGSLLPHYRGASPIQTSIMNDYKHFGLSVIYMNEGLDSGNIAAIQKIEKDIVARKNVAEIFHTLAPYGISLLEKVLNDIKHNTLQTTPQNHDIASYCKKLTKNDCYLDFIDSYTCYLHFLALGHIGVWTKYKDSVLKINMIQDYVLDNSVLSDSVLQDSSLKDPTLRDTKLQDSIPKDSMQNKTHKQKGTILAIKQNMACIACENGALWIESVTPQNKSKMTITSFLQSQNLKVGDSLVFE